MGKAKALTNSKSKVQTKERQNKEKELLVLKDYFFHPTLLKNPVFFGYTNGLVLTTMEFAMALALAASGSAESAVILTLLGKGFIDFLTALFIRESLLGWWKKKESLAASNAKAEELPFPTLAVLASCLVIFQTWVLVFDLATAASSA